MGSISHYIMPVVVNSLGVDTHANTQTYTHTHTTRKFTRIQTFADRSNFKKPGVRQPQAGTPVV